MDIEKSRELALLPLEFLHPAEVNYIEAASASTRNAAFRMIWTKKEAVVKLSGIGISSAFGHFSVVGGPAVGATKGLGGEKILVWSESDYTCAIAVTEPVEPTIFDSIEKIESSA